MQLKVTALTSRSRGRQSAIEELKGAGFTDTDRFSLRCTMKPSRKAFC